MFGGKGKSRFWAVDGIRMAGNNCIFLISSKCNQSAYCNVMICITEYMEKYEKKNLTKINYNDRARLTQLTSNTLFCRYCYQPIHEVHYQNEVCCIPIHLYLLFIHIRNHIRNMFESVGIAIYGTDGLIISRYAAYRFTIDSKKTVFKIPYLCTVL